MQIKDMKSYAKWRRMYATWINTGDGWFFSDLLFESVESLKRHYEGMPEFARENCPRHAKGWENAEIVIVPVRVAIPDETKEVQ